MPVEPRGTHGETVQVEHTEARHAGEIALTAIQHDGDQVGLPCPVAGCTVVSWFPPGGGAGEVAGYLTALRAALTRHQREAEDAKAARGAVRAAPAPEPEA